MKKLNFLAFLVAIACVSCDKSDAPTPTAFVYTSKPIDVAATLIGSWQLSLVGTLTPYTNSGGCGENHDSQNGMQLTWKTTSADEMLSFAKNGDFVQLKQSKQVCKGTYKLNISASTLTNDCASEGQNLSDVSDKSLTLDDGTTFLRFEKVSPNPQ